MWLVLSLAVFLGGFLRVWGLDKVPPELFGDEVDVGYQSYSLLKTGRDLYNQPMPTYIRSLSEPRAPLLMYATVPNIALFGLNEWGVRLTPALFGIIGILTVFLLAYWITNSPNVAAVSAAVLAFMPWHIHYSRTGFEVTLMTTLVMLGTILFLHKRLISSALFFGLAFYAYSTAVLFVPLLIVSLILLYRPKFALWPIITLIVILLPFAWNTFQGQTGNRFASIGIFSEPEIEKRVIGFRQQDPSIWSRLIYNRPTLWANLFLDQYVQAFSSEFLFVRGDPSLRHSYQFSGELLPITFIFIIPGIIWLAWKKKWLVLVWLLASPVSSALTLGGGWHATRLFLATVSWAIIGGVGVVVLWSKLKYLVMAILLIGAFFFMRGVSYYWNIYPKVSWRHWQMGYEEGFKYLKQVAPEYSRVFINNTYEPALIRFLFWTAYPPAKFHKEFTGDRGQAEIVPNYDGYSLDGKYFFGTFSRQHWGTSLLPNSLYMVSAPNEVGMDQSLPGEVENLHTSTNSIGEPMFYLVRRK